MADQPPNVYPFTRFADQDAAPEWLSRAFGLEEVEIFRDDEGAIQVSFGPGIVILGPRHPTSRGSASRVDDPDAHYRRAKAAGAEMVGEIEDTFRRSREYTARDPEGHVWRFSTCGTEPGA